MNDKGAAPALERHDVLPVELERRRRRLALIYKVSSWLFFAGMFITFLASSLERTLDRWGVTDAAFRAGGCAMVVGGIAVLIWGSMSRRLKKQLGRLPPKET